MQVARRDSFDHVVIETTGLANPAPIIETFVAFPVRVCTLYSLLLMDVLHPSKPGKGLPHA